MSVQDLLLFQKYLLSKNRLIFKSIYSIFQSALQNQTPSISCQIQDTVSFLSFCKFKIIINLLQSIQMQKILNCLKHQLQSIINLQSRKKYKKIKLKTYLLAIYYSRKQSVIHIRKQFKQQLVLKILSQININGIGFKI
ncbi:hypothetical protein TTHERM_000339879 (macronuclear) [Tetrahymena thermophila SB210]|uniref:Uncharacterized protein n=1 Tax=Tetrahymena thermophila (strain SB210) TaxID=312017 RepID=W7X9M2_TETTS|nr:hypothetical protein TTHERM_000339879 [Tetrahymena thermophila SB210]EWS74042.1 hypothetical protein TTHERM_000339879 [Tetrahymena thermophila SB210]|eukprot:XP_012653441.1 hypothetical protein TTHERM_000339879 [Tetrahymena thermophila SB210]